MKTIGIAVLSGCLLVTAGMAAGPAAAQTGQPGAQSPSTQSPSTQSSPDVSRSQDKAGSTATQGREGSQGTQSGPEPAAANPKGSQDKPSLQARPPETRGATGGSKAGEVDRSSATPGVDGSKGTQSGPEPAKAK